MSRKSQRGRACDICVNIKRNPIEKIIEINEYGGKIWYTHANINR